MKLFTPADILLPAADPARFAVIACDQHTSEPAYWEKVRTLVGDAPSAFSLILPEAFLPDPAKAGAHAAAVPAAMKDYLDKGVFRSCPNAFIYVERTLPGGGIRRGIVGALALEGYDYRKKTDAPVRATEETVSERIPPRVALRSEALLELPHVLMLFDSQRLHVSPLADLQAVRDQLPCLYNFDLMMDGGHIAGYLVDEENAARLVDLFDTDKNPEPFLMAVGDGNHSLAAAKVNANDRDPLSQKALVELVDIYDESLVFEPIYRLLKGVTVEELCQAVNCLVPKGCSSFHEITMIDANGSHLLLLPRTAALPVTVLQEFLDRFLADRPHVSIDYIHGIDALTAMAKETGAVGFLFEGMKKEELFATVASDGALVRKTFSMGEAADKRYYLEARRIRS